MLVSTGIGLPFPVAAIMSARPLIVATTWAVVDKITTASAIVVVPPERDTAIAPSCAFNVFLELIYVMPIEAWLGHFHSSEQH
jgi:hypothetical protein